MRMEIGRENLSDERLEDEPSVKNLLDYLSRLEKLSKSISEFRSSDFPKLFGTLLESNISQFTPPSEVWRSNSTQIRSDLVQIRRTLVSCQDVLEYVKTSSTIDPRVKREESHLREQSNRSNQTKGRSGTTTSQFKSDPSQIDLIKSYRVDYRSFKKLEVERKNFGFKEWIEELNREIKGSKKLRLISDDFVEVKGLMRVRLLFRKTDSRIIERVACFSNNELNSKIYQQSSYELFRSISRFMNQTINRYPFNCPNLLLISSLIASYIDFYSNSFTQVERKPLPSSTTSLKTEASNHGESYKSIEMVLLSWRIWRVEKLKDDESFGFLNGAWEPVTEYS